MSPTAHHRQSPQWMVIRKELAIPPQVKVCMLRAQSADAVIIEVTKCWQGKGGISTVSHVVYAVMHYRAAPFRAAAPVDDLPALQV